jgi:hypothetical protein
MSAGDSFPHFNECWIDIFYFRFFRYLQIDCNSCILSLFIVITNRVILEGCFLSNLPLFPNLNFNLLLQIQVLLYYYTAIVRHNLSACTAIILKVPIRFEVFAQDLVQILLIMNAFKVCINSLFTHY